MFYAKNGVNGFPICNRTILPLSLISLLFVSCIWIFVVVMKKKVACEFVIIVVGFDLGFM